MGKLNLSYTVAVILQALDHGYRYGFDIMDITGLPSGTVYPALRRMEEVGYILSRWERQSVAQAEQRPARKYYEIKKAGSEALAEARKKFRLLEQLDPQVRGFKPASEEG